MNCGNTQCEPEMLVTLVNTFTVADINGALSSHGFREPNTLMSFFFDICLGPSCEDTYHFELAFLILFNYLPHYTCYYFKVG